MSGELRHEFGQGLAGPGGQALGGDAHGQGQVPTESREVAGGLCLPLDPLQPDDAGEEFDRFLPAQQSQPRAVDGFQAGQRAAAGDQRQTGAVAGQQGADLVLVGGVVQKEQHPALAQHRAQQTAALVGRGGDSGLGHTERVQKPGEHLARRGGIRVHAAQVDGVLPVREAWRQSMGGVHGEGGLAQPGLPADHGDRRSGGIEALGQNPQPGQGGAAGGEVTEITRQRQPVPGRPRAWPCPGRRPGPRPADGPRTTRPGGVLQLLAHNAIHTQGRCQCLHRALPRPSCPPALHVRQRPHTDPRPLREPFLADARSRAQCVQPLAELVVAHSCGPPWSAWPGRNGVPTGRAHRQKYAGLSICRSNFLVAPTCTGLDEACRARLCALLYRGQDARARISMR